MNQTIKVKDNKIHCFKTLYSLLLDKMPPEDLMQIYFDDIFDKHDGEGSEKMQEFIVNNLKPSIKWSTGIGTMEAIEHMVDEAIANDNSIQ